MFLLSIGVLETLEKPFFGLAPGTEDMYNVISTCILANLRGWSKPYLEANIIDQRERFERVVPGSSIVHPLSDNVDAGKGKQCSDGKVHGKGLFPLCRSMRIQ